MLTVHLMHAWSTSVCPGSFGTITAEFQSSGLTQIYDCWASCTTPAQVPGLGEATGSVTIDTAAEVSRSADIVISLGKTWRLSRALFQNAKDFLS